ncbi:right-handed parallel beta-helix repeat-containing protein, partial [bacterium]|nr:right-handed parallel beta-helix repeat-containing protein [bacterium]
MRYIVFFVLILNFIQMSFGQISGSLSDTLGPGTYHVSDTIYVDAGDSLHLMPATTFIFDGPFPFKIEGTLLAEGTETDAIIFTTDTVANPNRWRGLRFFDSTSSGSQLTFCLIENVLATGPVWKDNYGAVLCDSSSPNFEHCTINNNAATLYTWYALGGGVHCRNASSASFTSCVIRNNSANYGGGLYVNHSQPIFTNCLITENSTSQYGAGACGTYSNTSFINCTFHDNINGVGWSNRGGIDCEHCSLTVNSTIIAFSYGTGIHLWDCAASVITYCDFYGSSGGNITFSSGDPVNGPPDIGVLSETNANGDSCDIYFNIFRAPLFENATTDDFHLTDDSRCIGAADLVAAPTSDFEGNPRPNPPGSSPDIGAFENENAAPYVPAGLSGNLSGILGPGHIYIIDTIYVNSGDSLTLQPGTTFDFYGPYSFHIEGTLLAEGTITDSIIFTTNVGVNPNRWRGLRFYTSNSSDSRLSFCRIENSYATGSTSEEKHGGGIYCNYSAPTFSNCLIQNNLSHWGGGVSCWYASPSFSRCIFQNDSAVSYGGGMYGWYSSPDFINCIFNKNGSSFGGGACCSGGMPSFIHCTFNGNSASSNGAGFFCGNASPILNSTIIAFSNGNGIYLWNASSSQIEFCDIFGSTEGNFAFSNNDSSNGPTGISELMTTNINGDSTDAYHNIFLHPGFLDSAASDFHLSDTSHCISAAHLGETSEDFEGNVRPNPPNSRPDIGAFENANGNTPPSGLAGSLSGTLGPGTYTIVDTIYVSADDSLQLLPGTIFYFYNPYPFEIYGTLIAEGTETDSIVFAADPEANPFGWRGLRFLDFSSSGSRLSYCLIKDGNATGATMESKRGGGAYCEYASPQFSHCDFRNNRAEYYGGGVACWYASPTLDKCSFISNSVGDFGGAYYGWYSNSKLTNCLLIGNTADFGGGVYFSGGTPTILHATLSGNSANYYGSGIYCSYCTAIIRNTIVAYSNEYGIYFSGAAGSQIEYCNLFGNSDGAFGFSSGDSSQGPVNIGVLSMTNTNGDSCDTYSNIFVNPMFVDSLSDFHLADTSHCISAAIITELVEDFDGNLRPNPPGSPPDIGAFENSEGFVSPYSISGNLSGILGPGTYHIIDTIRVIDGDSLRLLAGTTFLFDSAYPFIIQGTLEAEGTESDSIIFTNYVLLNPDGWSGLRFLSSSRSVSHLEYCRFENGQATGSGDDLYGGGVYCNQASPTFLHCDFVSNEAVWGGAVACWEASPTFSNCIFRNNEASDYGGGVYCWDSSPIFTNCIFNNNSSAFGGAVTISGASPMFIHCTMIENDATSGGGVLCIASSAIFNSSIIAFSEGDGVYFWDCESALFTYCDIYGNDGGNFTFSGDDSSSGPAGIGVISQLNANGDACDSYNNIFIHPILENLNADNFHLTDNSPCIGAGESGGIADDFEGNPRPNPGGSLPDIGVYEHELATPASYEGLIGALSGTLGPGVYHILGEISIDAEDSLRLMPRTTFIFDGHYPFEIRGVLLAEGTESDSIIFTADTIANPNRWCGLRFLQSVRSESRLAYCLIENGRATGSDVDRYGGGAYFNHASPEVSHCVFKNNFAEIWGGGVACYYASPTFTDCIFNNNESGTYGGGVYCWYGGTTFTHCVFDSNIADYGGGASCSGDNISFTRCTFNGNIANESGGGLFTSGGSFSLNSSIIAFSGGSGIYLWNGSDVQIEYCDFFENSAGSFAFSGGDSSNGPPHIGQLSQENINEDSCDAYMNIFLDPLFADTTISDFQILENSPCVDAGDPSISLDTDGTIADIGAFYYHYGSYPPSAFSLISPQFGDTCWSLDTLLVWHAAVDPDTGDTVTYEIWLDTLANLATAWEVDSELSDTSYLLTEISDDYDYYWTVHASDLNTQGTWANDTLMFHTYLPEPPDNFYLATPSDGDTVFTMTPTLRWHRALDPDPTDTVCYNLMWSYDSDFSSFEDTTLCDTSFTFPVDILFNVHLTNRIPVRAMKHSERLDEVEDDSTVYWKVQAVDKFGLRAWCEPENGWSFLVFIKEPPNAFDLISPINGDTLDTLQAEFVWQEPTDPDPGDSISFYRVYLALDSNFTTALDSQQVVEPELIWENLDDDQAYWWRVKTFDTYGNATLSNQSWSFHTYYPEPPDAFSLATPQNGDTVFTETPTLNWYKASDVDPGDSVCYRLYWSYASDFSVYEDTMVCDTTFTFPVEMLFASGYSSKIPQRVSRDRKPIFEGLDDVKEDSTVYWKVQAIDEFGLATWCEPEAGWSFFVYIEQPPNSFDLVSPPNNDTLDTLAAQFMWTQAFDPDPGDSIVSYRVYLALDSVLSAGLDSQDVAETVLHWGTLEDDQTYWWRVRAFDTHGNSTLSNQLWSFQTYFAEPPSTFPLAMPQNGDTVFTVTPTLKWFQTSDPDPGDTVCYRLVWSYNSEFSTFEDTLICDTSFTFPANLLFNRNFGTPARASRQKMPSFAGLDEVEDDSTVYWKVQAIDEFELTTWCTPETGWNFLVYIEQSPNRFDLISPADEDTLDVLAAEFQWEMGTDPDPGDSISYYRVYLALDSNFTTELDSQEVFETELLWESLRDDQTYWWRVKAFDTHNNSAFSNQVWNFHTYLCEVPQS